jgi:hypothetical protein
MDEAQNLRELAAWYRDRAERAGKPWVWEARLRRAEELEREAAHLDTAMTQTDPSPGSPEA